MSQLFFVCLPIIMIGVLADIAVKKLAVMLFKDGGAYELIPGILRITYAENKGAAFSILSGQRQLFIVLTVIVLVFAFYLLLRGHIRGLFGIAALSVCISGAIGNFIDRLFYGYVVDMFEPIFIDFAIFNVADILLNIGGVAIVVYILFFHKENTALCLDIKNSDFLFISLAGGKTAELCLYDGKIGFRIKEHNNGQDLEPMQKDI